MKTETLLLLGVVSFYFLNKRYASSMGPSFAVPYPPQPVNAVPPTGTTINSPIGEITLSHLPAPPANAGLQTCAANDGHTFFWPTNQDCPAIDFVANGVPYYIDAIGNPIPQTY